MLEVPELASAVFADTEAVADPEVEAEAEASGCTLCCLKVRLALRVNLLKKEAHFTLIQLGRVWWHGYDTVPAISAVQTAAVRIEAGACWSNVFVDARLGLSFLPVVGAGITQLNFLPIPITPAPGGALRLVLPEELADGNAGFA